MLVAAYSLAVLDFGGRTVMYCFVVFIPVASFSSFGLFIMIKKALVYNSPQVFGYGQISCIFFKVPIWLWDSKVLIYIPISAVFPVGNLIPSVLTVFPLLVTVCSHFFGINVDADHVDQRIGILLGLVSQCDPYRGGGRRLLSLAVGSSR